MTEPFSITSAQNERFKSLQTLREKKARDARQIFLVEGKKEIMLAVKNGFILRELWGNEIHALVGWEGPTYSIPESLFRKVGYREKTEGVIAVVEYKQSTLDSLNVSSPALVIVADHLEKPGNIGTLFRVADSVGATAIVLVGLSTDAYNPNVIRNSVGTFFAVPFAVAEPEAVVTWLTAKRLTPVVASPDATAVYHELAWPKCSALIVGREHDGVQSNWGKAPLRVKIPMRGQNDSLNVAVSTGVLGYEWARIHQR